jgi:hypothetical protein
MSKSPSFLLFANRKPIVLFALFFLLPIVGAVLLRGTRLEWFSWMGLSMLLVIRWMFELQVSINELFDGNLLNLKATRIFYYILSAIFLLITFSIININSIDELQSLNMLALLGAGVYASFTWVTARIINTSVGKNGSNSVPVFGYFFALMYFPIGLWIIQPKILRRVSKG